MRSFVTVNREEGEGGVELRLPPLPLTSPGLPPTREKSDPMPVYSGSGSPEDPYVVCFQKVDEGDPRQWGNVKRWSM